MCLPKPSTHFCDSYPARRGLGVPRDVRLAAECYKAAFMGQAIRIDYESTGRSLVATCGPVEREGPELVSVLGNVVPDKDADY